MAVLLYGGLLAAVLVLQSTILASMSVFDVKPDLILILVVVYAVYKGPVFGGVLGFVGGLLLDLYVGQMIGLQAFSKLLVGLGVGFSVEKVFRDNPIVPLAAVVAATAFDQIVYLLGMRLFGIPVGWRAVAPSGILFMALYNGVVTVILYKGLYAVADTIAYWDELFRRSG